MFSEIFWNDIVFLQCLRDNHSISVVKYWVKNPAFFFFYLLWHQLMRWKIWRMLIVDQILFVLRCLVLLLTCFSFCCFGSFFVVVVSVSLWLMGFESAVGIFRIFDQFINDTTRQARRVHTHIFLTYYNPRLYGWAKFG